MAINSIGLVETYGLTAGIAAADAMVKSANVKLLGYEYAKGDGLCTIKVEGNVGACKAAIEAGKRAAESVKGTHQGVKSVLLKARPADGIMDTMIKHRENVGGEQALAEGYRPKGESRMPVLVKNWKPAEVMAADAIVEPTVEAPESSEVEEIAEETATEEDEESESEDASAEDTEEAVVEEIPAEEAIAETEEVIEAKAEETPAEEAVAETEVSPVAETPRAEESKKSNSKGSRKRSRKRKTDKTDK